MAPEPNRYSSIKKETPSQEFNSNSAGYRASPEMKKANENRFIPQSKRTSINQSNVVQGKAIGQEKEYANMYMGQKKASGDLGIDPYKATAGLPVGGEDSRQVTERLQNHRGKMTASPE